MNGRAKSTILFVCIHNSARSQMAEAFVNRLAGDRIEARSAGLQPGRLNPIVVEAMREAGIDISGNATKSTAEMLQQGHQFDFVVTVCDETSAELCPVFPGGGQRLHWPFADPSAFSGTPEQKLAKTREVRDAIRTRVEAWLAETRRGCRCEAAVPGVEQGGEGTDPDASRRVAHSQSVLYLSASGGP
jgi:arsenate reductase